MSQAADRITAGAQSPTRPAGEARNAALVEALRDGVCVIRLLFDAAGRPTDYRFVQANEAFQAQSGLPDPTGRTIRELVPDFEPQWIETYARVAASGEAIRFEAEVPSIGGFYDIHAFVPAGSGPHEVAIVFTNTTARHHAEARLQASEARLTRELEDATRLQAVGGLLVENERPGELFARLLQTALDIVEAQAGTIQLLDPATQTLGFLAAQGFSTAMTTHFACVDAASASPCGQALARGQRSFVVFDEPGAADPDGSNALHLAEDVRCAQSTPLLSRAGRPLGMFSTHWRERRPLGERELRFLDLLARQAADLIERMQVHEALKERERQLREDARRKDEFIAVLAHELRNPLAPIRNGIELLRAASHEKVVEQVRPMMERQVVHMVRLIDDLLDVSRISSGRVLLQREAVSLRALVDSAAEANRAALDAAGLALRIALDEPERLLWVDSTRLSQVRANILHNATKFTPPGGLVTVSTALEPAHGLQPAVQVVRIADTGLGIAADVLPTIFELFTQVRPDSSARHGGMGIGLALARSLVELHGGSVTAASAGAGRGSEFTIRIPSAPLDPVTLAPATADAGRLAGLRILVVDDNRDAADSIGLLLAQHGGDVHVRYGMAEALPVLRQVEPALVLLDLGMPGIDGYEGCRLVRREMGAAVRIAALTGWGQEEDRQRAAEAGFDHHLTKPVDFARLMEIARTVAPAGARERR